MNNPHKPLPPVAPGWRERAKCNGADPRLWDADSLPTGRQRRIEAARRCEGCPVVKQCANFALTQPKTIGVVVAGLPIGCDGGYLTSAADAQLLKIAAYGLKVAYEDIETEPCGECGEPMATEAKWRKAGRPKDIRAIGGRGRCSRCYQRLIYRERKGRAA